LLRDGTKSIVVKRKRGDNKVPANLKEVLLSIGEELIDYCAQLASLSILSKDDRLQELQPFLTLFNKSIDDLYSSDAKTNEILY